MTDVNFKAGEFVIESFTLVNQYGDSIDLRGTVLSFRLYENIYQNFLTGDITILDGLDIIKNYRMTGQENIRISIKSKEGFGYITDKEFTIDKTFRVYKIINVSRTGYQLLKFFTNVYYLFLYFFFISSGIVSKYII